MPRDRGHAGVGTVRGDLSDAALHPSRGTREGSRRARLAASSTHACSCYAKLALAAVAEGRFEYMYVVRGKEGDGDIGHREGKFTYTSSVRRGRLYAVIPAGLVPCMVRVEGENSCKTSELIVNGRTLTFWRRGPASMGTTWAGAGLGRARHLTWCR